jgi:predicted nucleic acid-binding protein
LIYFDASLMVSLYTPDANTEAAVTAMQSAQEMLLISSLVKLEVENAMELRVFRREISRQQAEISLSDFTEDLRCNVYQLHTLPEAAFERASQLSRNLTAKIGTRAADILHVAAALELGATSFFQLRPATEEDGRSCWSEAQSMVLEHIIPNKSAWRQRPTKKPLASRCWGAAVCFGEER